MSSNPSKATEMETVSSLDPWRRDRGRVYFMYPPCPSSHGLVENDLLKNRVLEGSILRTIRGKVVRFQRALHRNQQLSTFESNLEIKTGLQSPPTFPRWEANSCISQALLRVLLRWNGFLYGNLWNGCCHDLSCQDCVWKGVKEFNT